MQTQPRPRGLAAPPARPYPPFDLQLSLALDVAVLALDEPGLSPSGRSTWRSVKAHLERRAGLVTGLEVWP